MQCLEVWGGNEPTDRTVSMAGLDAVVLSIPHGHSVAGGDIHYLSSCATGRIARVLLADVSGHGDSVSTIAQSLRDLMRRHINVVDPMRMVRGLNRAFTDSDTGGTFATAVAATYWAPNRSLVISNAGHPRPLVYRAATKQWDRISIDDGAAGPDPGGGDDLPLGIDAEGSYSQVRVRLEAGDVVLFYTDALIEASAQDGRMLGESGLLELVRSVHATDGSELVRRVVDGVAAYRGGLPAMDDTTIMAISPNDIESRANLRMIASGVLSAATARLRAGVRAMPSFGRMKDAGKAIVD
ncbi:MAG: serine/threonine-protein phosphatase [Phycisphaeraceae bacterium]|nr:serine/threonine-protein phosphatase [Phycisphaeraceae bacterium]